MLPPSNAIAPLTWPSLVAWFAEEFKAHSAAEEAHERITLGRLPRIAGAFDGEPAEITPQQWTGWLTNLDTGIPSKNKHRSMIGRIYRLGITRFVCKANPIEAVARFRRRRSEAPCYRTLVMIEADLDLRPHTELEKRVVRR